MSLFGTKPASTSSAFTTPQTNPSGSTFPSFSAPKPGPFSVSNLSGLNTQPQQAGTSAFGTQQQTTGSRFGGIGGFSSGTGTFGQPQQQQSGTFGSGQSQSGYGQQSGFGQSLGGLGGFGQSTNQAGTGTFGQSAQGTGGFGTFGGKTGGLGGGLFSQQQQPPQQQSIFGGSIAGGPPSFLQSQQQQQQVNLQPPITSVTRWYELPQSDQNVLEELEKYIDEQKAICEDLKTRTPQLENYVSSIPIDVAEVQKRFDATSHILAVDTTTLLNDLRVKFDKLSAQIHQTIRLLDVIRYPSASSLSYLASTHGAGGDSLIDFFNQRTVEWQEKVESFKREIAEIDRMLKAVEEGQLIGATGSSEEVLETIRAQWDGFCGLAARVGKLKERAAEVKIAVEKGLRGGRL